MKKIGVFVCHCGRNISSTVNINKVVEEIKKYPGVVICTDYKYLCSDPGQNIIKEKIKEKNLNGVVVACCSPSLHEDTFRRIAESTDLNRYLLEIANIREQCSWVHKDTDEATAKAINIIESIIEKTKLNESLSPVKVKVIPKVLVIGAGIAGIQASLDIANAGHKVILLEKSSSIGGHMAQLSETFPTLDCSQCILTPKMVEISHHDNIELLTYSELEEISGNIGNFKVKIRKKARYVDEEACTGCGDCIEACPVRIKSEFEIGLSDRTAICRPFPQAVPNKFIIDKKGIPPCKLACPAGVNVQAYVALTSQGKYKEALAIEREDNPFPSVCGRVCTHPCEIECKRDEHDESISIRNIKRFIADYEKDLPKPKLPKQKKKKIAIIGSGPSGLSCAYQLSKLGYSTTVFEALPVAGGMLVAGIPKFRLPRESLQKDINYIKSWGVEIETNQRIDNPEKLLNDGYDAIYIATGAWIERNLGIEGEELKDIYYGIDFLSKVNLGYKVIIGEEVAVIGGGNSAIDAARTAIRLNAKNVTIVYRRSRIEMPAIEEEILEAEEEGIKINYLASPIKFIEKNGKLSQMVCIKMKLGQPDASGRRRPIPIKGSEFTINIDTVILTIGQTPDTSFLPKNTNIKLNQKWNSLWVDEETFQTSVPGIFAGGDAVSGPSTVIDVIANGKEAAKVIDRYIRKINLKDKKKLQPKCADEVEIPPNLPKSKRMKINHLPVEERIQNFNEVKLSLNEEHIKAESARCLACGGCCECQECDQVCEPDAIRFNQEDEIIEKEVGAIIAATGYELYPMENMIEYGAGKYPDVINGLQFERLLSASGPTQGEVLRPSDNKIPKRVAFISCVGSRDPEHHLPYCSKICCMYMVKHALLYKEHVPDGEAIVFSIDIRTGGKDYEEFLTRAKEEGNILYIRGKPARIIKQRNDLVVWCINTLTGKQLRVKCDMVVLSMSMIPSSGALDLARALRIHTNIHGFFSEAHPKLRPVESLVPGFYLAGTAQGPKDIPDTVSQASGAAAKVMTLFSSDEISHSPIIASVNEDLCSGCGICVATCPYDAREMDERKKIVSVNDILCEGCGACISACLSGASQQINLTDTQIDNMIRVLLRSNAGALERECT